VHAMAALVAVLSAGEADADGDHGLSPLEPLPRDGPSPSPPLPVPVALVTRPTPSNSDASLDGSGAHAHYVRPPMSTHASDGALLPTVYVTPSQAAAAVASMERSVTWNNDSVRARGQAQDLCGVRATHHCPAHGGSWGRVPALGREPGRGHDEQQDVLVHRPQLRGKAAVRSGTWGQTDAHTLPALAVAGAGRVPTAAARQL
jgi:hypothetical protein